MENLINELLAMFFVEISSINKPSECFGFSNTKYIKYGIENFPEPSEGQNK